MKLYDVSLQVVWREYIEISLFWRQMKIFQVVLSFTKFYTIITEILKKANIHKLDENIFGRQI